MWMTVEEKIIKKINKRDPPCSRDYIFENIASFITSFDNNIKSIIIYGSMAVGGLSLKPTSDIDLIIFTKYIYTREDWIILKKNISNKFKRKVDLVVMQISNKKINKREMRDALFFEQVESEYKTLYGLSFVELVDTSIKKFKL